MLGGTYRILNFGPYDFAVLQESQTKFWFTKSSYDFIFKCKVLCIKNRRQKTPTVGLNLIVKLTIIKKDHT
jgi:hypothetical protein